MSYPLAGMMMNNVGSQCPICLDALFQGNETYTRQSCFSISELKNIKPHDLNVIQLSCHHLFHKSCISQWFLEKYPFNCPSCRAKISHNGDEKNHRFRPLNNNEDEIEMLTPYAFGILLPLLFYIFTYTVSSKA